MGKIWTDYNWTFWKPQEEPLPKKAKKIRKISIITTCMNRTYDLKKTYIRNILDNIDYPNVEFVLLNYNSSDDLDEWVKKYLSGWIEDGVVNYYKTTEPKYYQMGHSRNIAYKVAQGEIVNNVDADNYTGRGFVDAINLLAELSPKKAIFAKGKKMMHGRVGLYKKEFLELGGYDEDFIGYGYDDHDLVIRAMMFGYKFMWWTGVPNGDFARRIRTPRSKITKNMLHKNWKETEDINKKLNLEKIERKEFIANKGKHWGKATLIKNFKETIKI